MKNFCDQIMAKIEALEAAKQKDFAIITEKKEKTFLEIEKQRNIMKQAAAQLDGELYAEAKNEIRDLSTQAKMYEDRLKQLAEKNQVSEEDSEKTIQAIVDYERAIKENYEKNIIPALLSIEDITKKYLNEVSKAEIALNSWTTRIRPNYISFTGAIFGGVNGSNKSDKPVPVHPGGYYGGELVQAITNFLGETLIRKLLEKDK